MKILVTIFVCLLLVACQQVVKPSNDATNLLRQTERELALRQQNTWSFRGRIAVSDGNVSGTVRMNWQQLGNQFDIEISLPISNQKYRLYSVKNKVRLDGLGITLFEGDSAEIVLQQATGWRIPFQDMRVWLRGMRTNDDTPISFGAEGLPAQFTENGWRVDFRQWDDASTPMPLKVFASSAGNGKNASVRLQIDAWQTP